MELETVKYNNENRPTIRHFNKMSKKQRKLINITQYFKIDDYKVALNKNVIVPKNKDIITAMSMFITILASVLKNYTIKGICISSWARGSYGDVHYNGYSIDISGIIVGTELKDEIIILPSLSYNDLVILHNAMADFVTMSNETSVVDDVPLSFEKSRLTNQVIMPHLVSDSRVNSGYVYPAQSLLIPYWLKQLVNTHQDHIHVTFNNKTDKSVLDSKYVEINKKLNYKFKGQVST